MAKTWSQGTGIKITSNKTLPDLMMALELVSDIEVLAGFPEETTERSPDTGETDAYGKPIMGTGKSDITNAAIAYVQDNGSPELNIPARPFMIPAIVEAQDKLANRLGQVLKAAVNGGGAVVVEQGMHNVGLTAQLAIQNKINEGIPPPLADATLRNRARKGRKGAGLELLSRSKGYAPSMDFAKPLVDTGELRKSASYAIRSRRKRSK